MFDIIGLWHQKCMSDSKIASQPTWHTHIHNTAVMRNYCMLGNICSFPQKMTTWHSHHTRPSTSRWHSNVGMTFISSLFFVVLLVYTNKCNPMNALQRRLSENVHSYSHILMFITSSSPSEAAWLFHPCLWMWLLGSGTNTFAACVVLWCFRGFSYFFFPPF